MSVKQNGRGGDNFHTTLSPQQGFWFTYLPDAMPGPSFPCSGPAEGGTKVRFTWSVGSTAPPIVCSFGGSIVAATWLESSEQAECISPPVISTNFTPHSTWGGDVVQFQVSSDGSYWVSHTLKFLYYNENTTRVVSISPYFGFEYGGTELIVTGSGFLPTTGLSCVFAFDDSLGTHGSDHHQPTTMVPAQWLSSQTLSCIAPPSAPGKSLLTVTMNGGVNALFGSVPYEYQPQVFVSDFFPSFGPVESSTTVYIEGQGLWVTASSLFTLPSKCLCQYGNVKTQGGPVVTNTTAPHDEEEAVEIIGLECRAPPPQILQQYTSVSALVPHQKIISVPLSISFNSGGDWHSAGLWTYLDQLRIIAITPKHGSSTGISRVNVKLNRFLHLEEENNSLLPYCDLISSTAAIHNTIRVPALRMQNWEEGGQFTCTVGPLAKMAYGPMDVRLVLLKHHDDGSLKVATTTIGERQHQQFIIIPPLEVYGYSLAMPTLASSNGNNNSSDAQNNNNKRRQWIRVSGNGFLDVPEFSCRWSAAESPSSGTLYIPSAAIYISGEVALCSIVEEELLTISMGTSLFLGVSVNGQDFYGETISIDFINLLEVYPSYGLVLGGGNHHTIKVSAEGIDGRTDLQTILTSHLDCKWTLPDGSKSATKAQNITIQNLSSSVIWYCLVPNSLKFGNGSLTVESTLETQEMGGDDAPLSSHLLLSVRALDFRFVDPPHVLEVVPSHVLNSGGAILHLSGLNFDYFDGSNNVGSLQCIFEIGSQVITSEATVQSPFTAICLSPETRLLESTYTQAQTSAILTVGPKEWLGTEEARNIPIYIHVPPIVYSIKQQRNLVTVRGLGFIPSLSLSCMFGEVLVKAISVSTEGLQCLAPEDSNPGSGMLRKRMV